MRELVGGLLLLALTGCGSLSVATPTVGQVGTTAGDGTATGGGDGTGSGSATGSATGSGGTGTGTATGSGSGGTGTGTGTGGTPSNPPVAAPDASVVNKGASVQINVVANDSDPDGDMDVSTVAVIDPALHGNTSVAASGVITYTNDGGPYLADSFTYTVSDADGNESNLATVDITINNSPPIAINDAAVGSVGGAVAINVAANDFDTDDGLDLNTVVITSAATNGSTVINGGGTVTYTHNGGAAVIDSFQYTIKDLTGTASNAATVSISIPAPVMVGSFRVNDGPPWNNNPATYTCQEVCALLFGGIATTYSCSTQAASINNNAYSSSWGVGGCGIVAENYKLNTTYDCGPPAGCATSAYVLDNCTNPPNTNYCWQ